MVVLTENHGMVKVSKHALERINDRFSLKEDAARNLIRKAFNNGTFSLTKSNPAAKEAEFTSYNLSYGNYLLVVYKIDKFYKVITIVNRNTSKSSVKKKQVTYFKGKACYYIKKG